MKQFFAAVLFVVLSAHSAFAQDNGTPGTATPLGLISGTTLHAIDSIESTSDDDFFSFTLSEPAVIMVKIVQNLCPADLDILTTDAIPNTTGTNSMTVDNGDGGSFTTLLCAGVHYLWVNRDSGPASSTPYDIELSIYDIDTFECNNSSADASDINSIDTLYAKVFGKNNFDYVIPESNYDIDYYTFFCANETIVTAYMPANSATIGYKMVLYGNGASDNLLDQSYSPSVAQSYEVEYKIDAEQDAWVEVRGYDNDIDTTTYTLIVHRDTNNAFETAAHMNVCDTMQANTRRNDDSDFYSFTGNGSKVKPKIFGAPSNAGFKFVLYNSAQQPIDSNELTNGPIVIDSFNVGIGQYYIRIREDVPNTSTLVIRKYSFTLLSNDCSTLTAASPPREAGIYIFPNPTTGRLNISLPASMKRGDYALTNIQGQAILQGQATGTTEVNVQDIVPGIYFLRIAASGQVFTEKIIIQR